MIDSIRAPGVDPDSELQDLRQSLNDLALPPTVHYGQKVQISDRGDLGLKLILTEINQTVLPRLVTINFDPERALYLKISHRRLFECRSEEKIISGTSPGSRDLRSLSSGFVSMLRAALAKSQAMTIEEPSAIAETMETSMSCSAHLLLEAAENQPEQNMDQARETTAIELIKSLAKAWRMSSARGEQVEFQGNATDIAILETITDGIVQEGAATQDKTFYQRSDMFFPSPLEPVDTIVTVESTGRHFVALLNQEQASVLDAISFLPHE